MGFLLSIGGSPEPQLAYNDERGAVMPRTGYRRGAFRAELHAAAIGQAMDGRRLGDNATFPLTVDEQLRVHAVLQDWLGEHDPD